MTQLTPPTWSRVKAILADVLDLPPAERASYLEHVCEGQPALHRRLIGLVRAYAGTNSLSDFDSPARRVAGLYEPAPGSLIGRYRIVRPIGRGGMGAVYEALDEQLGRPVAVKLMQAGVASRSMLKRFELESRLLARLRHPGIAQIFEAGTVPIPGTSESAPFFAMELIPGATPITAFAEAARLSTEDRLHLFIRVCEAVTHGHQRNVIHRDLKPGNIVVDGAGQPKIIDFGVARATDAGGATTLAGELLGTLRYMSPEQVSGCDGNPEALDVRTDVYSLGVVLYELLTGQPPQPDPEGGVLASIREAQSRTPAPLSHLTPHLSGDIQTVALKAVQPDRHVRYQTVAELAADLGRILRHEPISARPLSAVYQLRLFAVRHRPWVAGLVTVLAALLLGIIGTSIGLVRARDAQRSAVAQTARAQRISNFLRNTIRSADPQLLPPTALAAQDSTVFSWETWALPPAGWGTAGPADVGVAGVLRHAAQHLDTEFGDDPALRAEVSILLAYTLGSLEDARTAASLMETALQIHTQIEPPDSETLLRTRILYARSLTPLGQYPKAIVHFRTALDTARRIFGPADSRTLHLAGETAAAMNQIEGSAQEALLLAHQTIQAASSAHGADSGITWLCHVSLVDILHLRDAPKGRAEFLSECHATIDGLSRTIGPDITPVAHVSWCLASVLERDIATLPQAEALQRRAVEIHVKVGGPDSRAVYDSRSALLSILLRQRKLAQGETLAREALESALRILGPRSAYSIKAQARLARVLTWEQRAPEEAESLARAAADGASVLYFPAEDYASYHQGIWAAAVRQRHHPEQAEAMLRERIQLRGSRTPVANSAWVEAYLYLQLAWCLADEGRAEEAAQTFRLARAWADLLGEPSHPILLNILDDQAHLDPAASQDR